MLYQDEKERLRRLHFLLEKSELYSKVLGETINASKSVLQSEEPPKPPPRPRGRKSTGRKVKARAGTKRTRAEDEDEDDATETNREAKRAKNDDSGAFKQPELLSGATLKDYQLEGVQWMIGLYEAGVSGILGGSHSHR